MGIFPGSLDLVIPTMLRKRLIEITEFLLFLKMYSPSSHLTYTAIYRRRLFWKASNNYPI